MMSWSTSSTPFVRFSCSLSYRPSCLLSYHPSCRLFRSAAVYLFAATEPLFLPPPDPCSTVAQAGPPLLARTPLFLVLSRCVRLAFLLVGICALYPLVASLACLSANVSLRISGNSANPEPRPLYRIQKLKTRGPFGPGSSFLLKNAGTPPPVAPEASAAFIHWQRWSVTKQCFRQMDRKPTKSRRGMPN